MPLDPTFKAAATHNESFLATFDLDTTPYLDWAVTTAFYVAVRYVDAYFSPNRPGTHYERNHRVPTDSRTRPIAHAYRELYNASIDARYGTRTFTPAEVKSLIINTLGRLKSHMLNQ